MNFGEPASPLSEHRVTGFMGLATLSMSVCRLSLARSMTSGSDAATGVIVHDTVGANGATACGDGDTGAGDGDASGLSEGVGEAIAGAWLTSEGEGVDATWPVARGAPHAQAIETRAIAAPSRTR